MWIADWIDVLGEVAEVGVVSVSRVRVVDLIAVYRCPSSSDIV